MIRRNDTIKLPYTDFAVDYTISYFKKLLMCLLKLAVLIISVLPS
jgi:hypothetical protein